MPNDELTQRERLREILEREPIVRAYELRSAGISPVIISRAVDAGEIVRISRGMYQRADGEVDANQALAEAAKRVPKGVIAMVSALAFHGLTDQMPRTVWLAISADDWWAPVSQNPPLKVVEMREKYLRQGIEHHRISGIDVPIYSIPKTLADVFRNSRLVDRSVAVESLRKAIEQKRATPAEIAQSAAAGDAWNIMRPYLEALTFNG